MVWCADRVNHPMGIDTTCAYVHYAQYNNLPINLKGPTWIYFDNTFVTFTCINTLPSTHMNKQAKFGTYFSYILIIHVQTF